jgi:hypothetical protein
MSSTYRVVKLQKNHLYPTYQLHAFMANDKTTPQDGLRLAALTTMHWLKTRLGDDVPEAWSALPSPEEYLSATDGDMPSLYINQGHVVNVVSLPDKGMWTLQITEPDLGSDPGNPEQSRPAIPGRIIETNIAFQIVGKQLECGFKTIISDPVGTEPEAEVYRIAVVRQLMRNPAFGLKQVMDIPMAAIRLTNASQVKTMLFVTHHADNALPSVIFTQPLEEHITMPVITDLSKLRLNSSFTSPNLKLNLPGLNLSKPTNTTDKVEMVAIEPPYDLEKFCYYTFSHCRTYVLEDSARKSFSSQSGISFAPGDIVVLYPTAYGGGQEVVPFRKNEAKRAETIQLIEIGVKSYLKARPIDFGKIEFLSGAREHLFRLSDELMESAEAADAHFKQELEQLNAFWKGELAQKNRDLDAVTAQLQRQKEYAARLEDEKAQLREECAVAQDKMQAEIDAHKATIEFLQRRYDQPKDYDGIVTWVEEHFSERLFLHPKAISRMLTKSNQCADIALVCDALDYLATDYWEQRYMQLPKEIALTRCGEKYGRPFDVKPTGQVTIEFTPSEYRIKYFKNAQGIESDSDLDYHLRVGNDPENLLRIYFLHDDAQRLIVIGSLPDHLRAVKVQ